MERRTSAARQLRYSSGESAREVPQLGDRPEGRERRLTSLSKLKRDISAAVGGLPLSPEPRKGLFRRRPLGVEHWGGKQSAQSDLVGLILT